MKATASIHLDKRRSVQSGLYPVKLRVSYNSARRYYSIKKRVSDDEYLYLSEGNYEKVISLSPRGRYRDMRFQYDTIVSDANTIINSLPAFTFQKFKDGYNGVTTRLNYVSDAFTDIIEELRKDDRIGYATSLNSTLVSVKYFMEKRNYPPRSTVNMHSTFTRYKKLKFDDIDVNWLKAYKKFLIDNSKSISTIGIYERNIRMLFNRALANGVKADYPFNVYKCSTSKNKKRPLTIDQIKAIADYEPIPETNEGLYRDLFMFSLFCNGANISDVLRLKHKNIVGDEIIFERYKTRNKSEKTSIVASMSAPLQKIISTYVNSCLTSDDYLFQILDNGMDESQRYARIQSVTKLINKNLKTIAGRVGFDDGLAKSISTYYARHSYSTLLKNNNVSIAEISESLGHSSIQTTQNYLSSIDSEQRAKTANKLVDLLK